MLSAPGPKWWIAFSYLFISFFVSFSFFFFNMGVFKIELF